MHVSLASARVGRACVQASREDPARADRDFCGPCMGKRPRALRKKRAASYRTPLFVLGEKTVVIIHALSAVLCSVSVPA